MAAPVLEPRTPFDQIALRVERELIESAGAPPDEGILAKLASREFASFLELQDLQHQLYRRLMLNIGNPEAAHRLARVLRELHPAATAANKRVCMTLTTAGTLRGQRRLLAQQLGARDGG